MSKEYLRPGPLFGLAIGLGVLLIVSAFEDRSATCVQTTPTWDWFTWLFWLAGPISVFAAAGGVFAYGIRHSFGPISLILAPLAVAVLWTGLGLFVLLDILVSSTCLN